MLDIAGFSCSSIRRKFTDELLQKAIPTVIKGNYSEIFAMYNREYKSAGVDADEELSKEKTGEAAVSLANKYNTIFEANKPMLNHPDKIYPYIVQEHTHSGTQCPRHLIN